MSRTPPLFSWRQAVLESDLPAPARHLLLTLACYMDVRGEGCFPSIERLVAETGMSRSSVMKHRKLVLELGWIAQSRHGYGGQRWARSEYRMAWPAEDKGSAPGEPPRDEKAVRQTNRLESQGGAPDEPPLTAIGGAPDTPPFGQGGSPDGQKVVRETDPITPVTTPEPPSGAPAPARAWGERFEISFGNWQPTDTTIAGLRMSGAPMPSDTDVAEFVAHFNGTWMTPEQADGRFVKWMIRAGVYRAEAKNRGRRNDGSESRNSAFARIVGDPR